MLVQAGAYETAMAKRSIGLVYQSCVESHFKTHLIWILTYSCKRALRLLLWLLWIPKSHLLWQ